MSKRNLIWCEVTCSCCGVMSSSSGWYSPARIKKLKEDTKEWILTDEYNVVCPECKKSLE